MSESQSKATAKYRAKSVRQIQLKFYPKDHDLYERLKTVPNRNSYIIDLIRRDLGGS